MDRVYNIIKRQTIWNQIQRSVRREGETRTPRQTMSAPFYRYLDFIKCFTIRRIYAFLAFAASTVARPVSFTAL